MTNNRDISTDFFMRILTTVITVPFFCKVRCVVYKLIHSALVHFVTQTYYNSSFPLLSCGILTEWHLGKNYESVKSTSLINTKKLVFFPEAAGGMVTKFLSRTEVRVNSGFMYSDFMSSCELHSQ